MIHLHPHSQTAYNSILALLPETHKAAVIHPTGTGKSFIAFRLTERYAEKRFVWLSPSETIFKTQCQNVNRAYGYKPENVIFATYAKLAYISDLEMQRWKPDYIILDEFHRCGAKEWGFGVQRVLNMYPDAMLVGLSATNIRYLDNQRDMAMELFDGCIADQITLPEAIARGILPAPKYVISIYSYEKELHMIERRMKQGGQVAQHEAQRYYEQLRRALDKAPNFGQLFKKHMPNAHGKYIVFCANIEHLRSMAARAKQDFALVDAEPHLFRVYEGSPSARTNFEKFKKDESDHLKLLYCVDMLNEGVHVDDLSGVILFRPTVSPIIYKQQIGRALSVGDGRTPVIFDIVNNFDGLYTVSALSAELSALVNLYRNENRDNMIEVDSFEVIDELRDCREILQQIENALASTWDAMYREAEKYYQKHGDLLVPKKYYTPESNLPLGLWIITQRRVYRGMVNGTLTPERIEKLNRIGMVWEEKAEWLWEEGYRHAEAYYQEQGNLDVVATFVCADGYRLGTWISNQRGKKKGRNGRNLTDEQITRLEQIGMIWSQVDYAFEQGYLVAKEYLEEHGDLWVPASYVTADGFRLGNWLLSKRQAYANQNESQLTDEQRQRLEALGFVWDNRHEVSWEEHYREAAAYVAEHGNLDVRFDYRQNGKCIYRWLSNQRDRLAQGKLSEEKRKRLEALNPAWQDWLDGHPITEQNRDLMSFEYGYPYALAYHRANGNLRVPRDYVTGDGFPLGQWTKAMRAAKVGTNKKPLTAKQIQQLEALGMFWNKNDELWENNYDIMRQYVEEHDDMNMPQNYKKPLGTRIWLWMYRNLSLLQEGRLPEDKLKKLEALGTAWTEWLKAHSSPAQKKISLSYSTGLPYAKAFRSEYGHLRVPKDYAAPDGYPLGSWIMAMRDAKEHRHHRSLTDAQVAELESLGMYWSRLDEIWDENYLLVRRYFDQHGDIDVPKHYENGARIRRWLRINRDQVAAGTIKPARLSKLKSFGDAWVRWVAQ